MQTQVVTLDVLKPIGTTVDLSDSFNARVGDKMTPFQEGGIQNANTGRNFRCLKTNRDHC